MLTFSRKSNLSVVSVFAAIIITLNLFASSSTFVYGRTWPRSYNGTVFLPSSFNTSSIQSSSMHRSNDVSSLVEVETNDLDVGTTPPNTNQTDGSHSPVPSRNINAELENLCRKSSAAHRLHPHPNLCAKYIQCGSDGTVYLMTCGPGTVFNAELQVCDWPKQPNHCETDDVPNGDNLQGHRTKRSSSKKGTTVSPDPNFCNKYRLHYNDKAYSTQTCGQGTLFNPLNSVCDFANNVDCASRKSDFGTYGCGKQDKYRAPHPDHCNKFVECKVGVLAIITCPPGTLFKRDEEKCAHSFRVTCSQPVSLKHDLSSHRHKRSNGNGNCASTRQTRQSRLNLACDYNYIAPHPHNCHQFVECEDKRIYIKNCGPGTAFNSVLGQCDWPYNVREVDPSDCTRYRQCDGRHFVSRRCAGGQIFVDEVRRCTSVPDYLREQQCRRAIPATTTTTTSTTPRPFIPPPPPS